MRAKELKPIFDQLQYDFPDFRGHKRLFLENPIRGLLRAVHFDPSAFDKCSFYVSTLVMPLCVPEDHLSLLFGDRVRHHVQGDGWKMTMPDLVVDLSKAIREQAIPFLSRADTLLHFVDVASGFSSRNPHVPKNIAFALARAGEHEGAVATIDALLSTIKLDVAWKRTIADETAALRHLLVTDPSEAHRKLKKWEDYTIKNLGLDKFREKQTSIVVT